MDIELKLRIDEAHKIALRAKHTIHNLKDGTSTRTNKKIDQRIKWVINGDGYSTAYDAAADLGVSYGVVYSRCGSGDPAWIHWMKLS